MELGSIEKAKVESRSRNLIMGISPSRGKKRAEKDQRRTAEGPLKMVYGF